jgi:hypothetical protein
MQLCIIHNFTEMNKLSKLLKALSATTSWSLTSPRDTSYVAGMNTGADQGAAPGQAKGRKKQHTEGKRPNK